ncbi:S8 family serine peptidase [Bacillus sp. 1P06AnD]|uniref:S8 family serine peptidase n=1 Tax=Bacillus sp. 1P06AnD TaxID=3132208 RepID=UPI0039A12F74
MKTKKFLLLICCMFIMTIVSEKKGIAQTLSENGGQNSMIMLFRNDEEKKAVKKKLATMADIRVKREFHYAINGLSITGKKKALLALKREYGDDGLYDSASYKSAISDSIPFIGGNSMRGLYDQKKNRLTGKGIKVGVIDTGVDYLHPDLRKAYRGGRDLVDLDNDPMETKKPAREATFHGTHVAGIIAANGKGVGIAPEAELYAYRALGPGGSGNSESVIAAIEAAIEDKMDVINLSLGSSVNAPDMPVTEALNRAVSFGITAVVSSGNSGPGVWTVGSPGTAEKAISVGASSPPINSPFLQAGLGNTTTYIPVQQILGALTWKAHPSICLSDAGSGKLEEYHRAKGKIVLIERGGDTLYTKVDNALKHKAAGVIIYNSEEGSFIGSTVKSLPIPAVTISRKDGLRLKELLGQSSMVKTVYRKQEDLLADFSSRGPVTVNWSIKPDVVAPGVKINSTVPDGYMYLQGTSMAAPHVTGAVILLKQAHPHWKPEQIKSALMTTAKVLTNEDGEVYKTYEQGAGRIQIDQAVKADTFLYPSSVTFGLFNRKQSIEEHEEKIIIENTSDQTKHYAFWIPPYQSGLSWHFPRKFTLKPKEKKEFMLGLTVHPNELEKGIYDGFITLAEGTKPLHIPFIYLKAEVDYPKVMGFHFDRVPGGQSYRYGMYVLGGADKLTIALYDFDTFRFAGILDQVTPAPTGLLEKEVARKQLPGRGLYRAVIILEKEGRTQEFYQSVLIA